MNKLILGITALVLFLGNNTLNARQNPNVLIQGQAAQDGNTTPRTLEGYIHQEDAFLNI